MNPRYKFLLLYICIYLIEMFYNALVFMKLFNTFDHSDICEASGRLYCCILLNVEVYCISSTCIRYRLDSLIQFSVIKFAEYALRVILLFKYSSLDAVYTGIEALLGMVFYFCINDVYKVINKRYTHRLNASREIKHAYIVSEE